MPTLIRKGAEMNGRNALAAISGLGLALAAVGFGPGAQAHPHTFVEATATLRFGAEHIIQKVDLSLALDEMTTAILVEGLDINGNGVYDPEELQALAAENASALEEFDYFTELAAAGQRVPVSGLDGFGYRYTGERLVLTLELSLAEAVDPTMQAVTLRLYDPTFYVMVDLDARTPVEFAGVDPGYCAVTVAPPEQGVEMTLSEAMFQAENPEIASIGRDFANIVSIACPPHS